MQNITREAIVADLIKLGLGQGDIVLLQSSLSSIGHVEGGAETVLDAFLHVLGPTGTLVAPVFGKLGIITDKVREHPSAVCSKHPLGTVAAIGPHAVDICRNHHLAATAHAHGTPYMRIAELGGWICLLGVDQDRNTTLHTVEALLELPYLCDREVTIQTGDGPMTRSVRYYPGPHRDFLSLDRVLRERAGMKTGRVGQAVTRLVRSQTMIDTLLEVGRRDPAFALCNNPNCRDCVLQRADLRRARFKQETFTLVASALLAGRYVDDIIENCRAAGIDYLELDAINGQPIDTCPPEVIAGTIHRLKEAGMTVTALRSGRVSQDYSKLLDAAVTAGIKRLILPLGCDAKEVSVLSLEKGVDVSFVNNGQDAAMASEMLKQLKDAGLPTRFVFDAAAFARIGEKPFLFSYKQKIRRYLHQLDIGDSLRTGEATTLGHGQAEIKELISILRCSCFEGYMLLSACNRHSSLRQTVDSFIDLLDQM